MQYFNYVLLATLCALVALSTQSNEEDMKYHRDLAQINYYNWLLHRHRTEKQKIEKVNSDIKSARLAKLQQIIDTPAPNNISLIATDANFEKIRRLVHPVANKPVTESLEDLTVLLTAPQLRRSKKIEDDGSNNSTISGVQSDAVPAQEGLVEFQLSEREYQKFAKFLSNKTLRKQQS